MQNNKKKIIAIVGKTRGGKDTVAKYIEEQYGFKPVCSYTTRPKRDYETDGVEHYFISDEEMNNLLSKGGVIAYAKKPNGVQYCATLDSLYDDWMTYIIDPEGIDYLKKNFKDVIDLKILYVDCPENLITERAKLSGVDAEVTKERLKYERLEFDAFRDEPKNYDALINNTGTLEELKASVDRFMNF